MYSHSQNDENFHINRLHRWVVVDEITIHLRGLCRNPLLFGVCVCSRNQIKTFRILPEYSMQCAWNLPALIRFSAPFCSSILYILFCSKTNAKPPTGKAEIWRTEFEWINYTIYSIVFRYILQSFSVAKTHTFNQRCAASSGIEHIECNELAHGKHYSFYPDILSPVGTEKRAPSIHPIHIHIPCPEPRA